MISNSEPQTQPTRLVDHILENAETGFKIRCLAHTESPQTLVYLALHQDYSSDWVGSDKVLLNLPSERRCGEIAVNRLLEGNKGEWGCLEHPQITFSLGFVNHGTWQQLRTHRIGVSFDIQSFRYTYENVIKAANREIPMEEIIFFDKVGVYKDRQGNKTDYTEEMLIQDKCIAASLLCHYKKRVTQDNVPPERARRMLPFDYRQHGVFSANLRSILHVLDLRAKGNAQAEIVAVSELLFEIVSLWCPDIAYYYERTRFKKALLSP
jgi:thymidylate synthase (FAD)